MGTEPGPVLQPFVGFGVFLASLVATTVLSAIAWELLVHRALYDCTDPGGIDYLSPGDWVHHYVAVEHVTHGRPMSEPDTLKHGWTVSRLWVVWSLFPACSFVVSAVLAILSMRLLRPHRGPNL